MAVFPLRNQVQTYAWGSRTALADLLGLPNPSGEPQAELWLGAHTKAPSDVLVDDRWLPLDAAIAQNPAYWLGDPVASRHGRLPFLLKILCADAPLSIQTHPDAASAAAGYAADNARGLAPDAPDRNYRDPYAKPETIFPLSTFKGMSGLRPLEEIIANFLRACPRTLHREICELRKSGRVGAVYGALLNRNANERAAVLTELRENLDQDPSLPEADTIRRLLHWYPTGIAVLSPLILRTFTLQPGQALHNAAGILHAWLDGSTIEIMGSSDNVLRGGLTIKHVDVPELLRIADFRPSPGLPLTDALGIHEIDGHYRFQRLRLEGESPFPFSDAPAIVLCLSGSAAIGCGDGCLVLNRGDSAYLTPAANAHLSGSADLAIAAASLK